MRLRLTIPACAAALAVAGLTASAAGAAGGGATAPPAGNDATPSGGGATGQSPAARRRPARRAVPAPAEAAHRFPVAGAYNLGGAEATFGASRRGHRHQGQDVAATEGTPVVAPWAGLVEFVRFQRSGAGWYVVLDGDGEDRDYVFMHLRRGSILVAPGQRVSTGQPIAQVGNTGSSTGPHLHFEIWVGGWYDGGEPIEPLPLLQQWTAYA